MNVYFFLSFIACIIYLQAVVYFLVAMPGSRVNRVFAASAFAFAWFSFFLLLFQHQEEAARVYLFDRLAVFGWAAFPVLLTLLFFYLNRNPGKPARRVIFYLLIPLAVANFLRYQYHPASIKTFYKVGDIWYYSVNLSSPWAYIFVTYLLICGAVSFYLVYSWLLSGKTNKEKLQARVVFFSLAIFFFFSLVTNIALPFGNRQSLPAMAHFNFIPLIIGIFFSLTNLQFIPFDRETLSRFVARHIPAHILSIGSDMEIWSANPHALKTLGYSPGALTGMKAEKLMDPHPDLPVTMAEKEYKTGKSRTGLVHVSGNRLPVDGLFVFSGNTISGPSCPVFIGLDRGEQDDLQRKILLLKHKLERLQEQNRRLRALIRMREQEYQGALEQLNIGRYESERSSRLNARDLKEKEQLIKEIHHRVKNNMQMVISLVNMLKHHRDISAEAAGKLGGIADRIRYISATHEDFYATPYLSRIHFGKYLHKVTGQLNSQVRPPCNVVVHLNVADEYLPVDLALPCGLVFHELLYNALVHAFPDSGAQTRSMPGVINVDFSVSDQDYQLVVNDNGVGIPENSQTSGHPATFGLHVVEVLVREHLKGEFEVKRSFGTRAIVRFRHPDVIV